ncbi:unnamed protein product [Miscanthus lutarioriparius]|uniref:DUF3615 domain-containing protein n=1 Tax=Miscanthus lutarioriparius TaxID=422564 RepID=A0A811PXG8_9POAL|nr:unnamed protein product [Miscanthus lutarioriparius]
MMAEKKNLQLSLPEFATSYGREPAQSQGQEIMDAPRLSTAASSTWLKLTSQFHRRHRLARKINPHKKYQYLLTARPDVVLEKSKRLGKGALAHYNRRKKIKFELLDVMPVVQMPESGRLYTHINFTARSSKEGSKEKLFFAELYNCSKRRDPSSFLVTCCEPLGSDATVGHKGFQLDGATVVRKNIDFARCFACGPRMLHPRGDKYIAGHCNVAHIYTNTC